MVEAIPSLSSLAQPALSCLIASSSSVTWGNGGVARLEDIILRVKKSKEKCVTLMDKISSLSGLLVFYLDVAQKSKVIP